jgi:hypothetical protein
LLGSW